MARLNLHRQITKAPVRGRRGGFAGPWVGKPAIIASVTGAHSGKQVPWCSRLLIERTLLAFCPGGNGYAEAFRVVLCGCRTRRFDRDVHSVQAGSQRPQAEILRERPALLPKGQVRRGGNSV